MPPSRSAPNPASTPPGNIKSAALQLARAEYARLAERLIASLDEGAEIERARAAEIRRRVRELRAGTVVPMPGEQVFDELKTLLQ